MKIPKGVFPYICVVGIDLKKMKSVGSDLESKTTHLPPLPHYEVPGIPP